MQTSSLKWNFTT